MENNNNNLESEIMKKLSKNINNMTESTFSLKERYDIVEMAKLLHSKILDPDYVGSIKKYKQHAENGAVKVNYTRNKIGRLNIKADGLKENETLTTQACMWGDAKSVLCSKIYYDLDVVNSHPIMLKSILDSYGIECDNINHYVMSRDLIIETYGLATGLTRKDIKTLICRLFYGGSVKAFINERDDITEMPEFFTNLEEELKRVRTELLNKPELLDYRIEARTRKSANKWDNEDGTALSLFLMTHECNVLMVMYNTLTKINDKFIGALIHDGMHIDRKIADDYGIDKLIEHTEKCIKHQTGFDLKLKIKKFETVPKLEKMITVKTDKEAGDFVSDKLKNDYVICNERIFMRINNVWSQNDKNIKRNLTKEIGNFDIWMEKENAKGEVDIVPLSKMCKGSKDILNFVEPTEDDDFVDNLWTSNLGKLCFKNGYYNFKEGKLMDYDIDTHTTIKINRDFKPALKSVKQRVMDLIFNPIFNNNQEQLKCWLNYIARGLAGCVEDKNWAVGMGERDCGKGVLVGLLENAFGEYCRSTNSENMLFKNNGTDSAKALSWLVPFEFRRLLLTNEITRDAEDKYRINGNILKKLSSGGDRIEARVNHKDEINFKIQSRVCMFCNDLPPIEPSDAKETAYMFKYPSKFVAKDDPRLGKPVMRQEYHIDDNEDIIKHFDDDGNPIMINITSFYLKDDEIKLWCKKPEVIDAFIEIIFDNYSDKVDVPKCMKEEQSDFKEDETDESKFYDLFAFDGDINYDANGLDWLSISVIGMLLKKNKINASPQKYKNWLLKKGCAKCKKTKKDGKRVASWINIQVDKGKKAEMIELGFSFGDDED